MRFSGLTRRVLLGWPIAAMVVAACSSENVEVLITSDPQYATVLVDGRRAGATPVTVPIPSKRSVSVAVEQRGFKSWRGTFEADSAPLTVHAKLTRAADFGSVVVESDPPGASVVVDGVPQSGVTPVVVGRLWTGEAHTVVVSAPHRAAETVRVAFSEERQRTVRVSLRPQATPQVVATVQHPVEELRDRRGGGGSPRIVGSPPPSSQPTPVAVAPAQPTPTEPAQVVPRTSPPDPQPPPATPPARVAVTSAPSNPSQPPSTAPPPHQVVLRASVGTPRVDGLLDRSALRSALRGMSAAVTSCYSQAYSRGPFDGSVRVSFRINDEGRVRGVAVTGPIAARVSSCVTRVIESGHFPASTAQDAFVALSIDLRAR